MKKQQISSMNFFERHLTLWVGLCIIAGIGLGKLAPDLAKTLDGMSIFVGVLIEVPLMLFLVRVCQRTRRWFRQDETSSE